MKSQRSARQANFTNEEKVVLIEIIEKYREIVEIKKSNSNITKSERNDAWQAIADEFNASFAGNALRTPKQIMKCWENIKARQKKTAAQLHFDLIKTGGGCSVLDPEVKTEATVLDILGQTATPLPSMGDCDENDDVESFQYDLELTHPYQVEPDTTPSPAVKPNRKLILTAPSSKKMLANKPPPIEQELFKLRCAALKRSMDLADREIAMKEELHHAQMSKMANDEEMHREQMKKIRLECDLLQNQLLKH